MNYVKHKEYNKYGEIKNGLFTQHKWVKKNQDKLAKRKQGEKPLTVGEFEHLEPQSVTDEFYKYYEEVSYSEYIKCLYKDYLLV